MPVYMQVHININFVFFFSQNSDTWFLSKVQLHSLIFNKAETIKVIRNMILVI